MKLSFFVRKTVALFFDFDVNLLFITIVQKAENEDSFIWYFLQYSRTCSNCTVILSRLLLCMSATVAVSTWS